MFSCDIKQFYLIIWFLDFIKEQQTKFWSYKEHMSSQSTDISKCSHYRDKVSAKMDYGTDNSWQRQKEIQCPPYG